VNIARSKSHLMSRCVTASASVTQLLSVRPLRSKPFRVTNAERSLKKGLTAHALEDLLVPEDGTEIDSEDFFQTVPENSVLMVLDKGEKWTPLSVSVFATLYLQVAPVSVIFDQPKDFIGCLNVKATLYGAYSVSYEVRLDCISLIVSYITVVTYMASIYIYTVLKYTFIKLVIRTSQFKGNKEISIILLPG
uniref:Cell death inducing DFFA like effector c n=1 Tax=Neogobius melanostomus TaxID=47308 RepID=A0A8C6UCP0_9GOBI